MSAGRCLLMAEYFITNGHEDTNLTAHGRRTSLFGHELNFSSFHGRNAQTIIKELMQDH